MAKKMEIADAKALVLETIGDSADVEKIKTSMMGLNMIAKVKDEKIFMERLITVQKQLGGYNYLLGVAGFGVFSYRMNKDGEKMIFSRLDGTEEIIE